MGCWIYHIKAEVQCSFGIPNYLEMTLFLIILLLLFFKVAIMHKYCHKILKLMFPISANTAVKYCLEVVRFKELLKTCLSHIFFF